MTARQAVLGAVLALPIALLMLATPPGARVSALAAALAALAGLLLLEPALRRHASEGTALWTIVLAAYGTGLFPLLAHAPDARRAIAFLLGAIGVRLLGRDPSAVRLAAVGLTTLAGVLLAAPAAGGPGLARAWFGSRGGLLFETPLLWGALAGLVVLARRGGREARALVIVALLPFAIAPFATGPLDVAWPALLVALAAALEAACGLVARQPGVLLPVGVVALAASNLLFMEQYRHTLRRDDTVSFPAVSERNARLLSSAMGSPNAWPANWAWTARHRLPVERWDLLSGQRLQPGATIDVGDLDQDDAFLLGGWSVRHECGDAVCREVEGRAEMAIPLERGATADLHVFVAGAGALRVSVNGETVGTLDVHGELIGHRVPRCAWRRGVNRVVLESVGGTQLVDRLEIRSGEGP